MVHPPSYTIKSSNTKGITEQCINCAPRTVCRELFENMIIIIWAREGEWGRK
jgi:hypothetical protein